MRVTDEEVKEIFDTDIALTPHITVANQLVDKHLQGQGIDEDMLKEIERWLAAHFAAIQDPRATSESISDLSESYDMQKGLMLDATQYGQQAKVLDSSGKLAELGQKTASIKVI